MTAKTLFQKLWERHEVVPETADTPAVLYIDLHLTHEVTSPQAFSVLRERGLKVRRPDRTLVTMDHSTPTDTAQIFGGVPIALESAAKQIRQLEVNCREFGLDLIGLKDARRGIVHIIGPELGATQPGKTIVCGDSHTSTHGAFGALAFGIGTTEVGYVLATQCLLQRRPKTLAIEVAGRLGPGVTAKDLVLHLLAEPAIRAGAGVGKVFEFGGEVIRGLSTDERATLTNMTAELGGFTGLVEPDAETVRFLSERRGIVFTLEPWMKSDAGAQYADVMRIDCSAMTPMVARPGDPGNGVPLSALAERPRLDIAYGGSCTAGKREDFDHYHAVLAWAAGRGLRVADGVKLYLQFGTVAVRDYCARRGYLAAFEAVGAELLQPACGACANCGPGSSTSAEQVTVSATNRNFPGRSGPGQVWLASPPTVAASAIAGRLCSFAELRAGGD